MISPEWGIGLAVTLFLGWLVYRHNQRTFQASVAEKRAYLEPTFRWPLFDSHEQDADNYVRVSFDVELKNTGQTTAELVLWRCYGVIGKTPPRKLIKTPWANARIPPGFMIEKGTSHKESITMIAPAGEWQDVLLMNLQVYCVGKAVYRDYLQKERVTGFCFVVVGDGKELKFLPAKDTPLNFRT